MRLDDTRAGKQIVQREMENIEDRLWTNKYLLYFQDYVTHWSRFNLNSYKWKQTQSMYSVLVMYSHMVTHYNPHTKLIIDIKKCTY